MLHKTVLIVEQEATSVALLEEQSDYLGLRVELVGSVEAGFRRAEDQKYDMLIIGRYLSGLQSAEACRQFRERFFTIPILVLSSDSSEAQKILAFEAGADEFLSWPLSVLELRARMRALLRRSSAGAEGRSPMLVHEDLIVDDRTREVKVKGEPLVLTHTEYELLRVLMSTPGQVFSREALLETIWGDRLESYEYNVTTHMSRLRTKLKQLSNYDRCIKTVRGVGYYFADENRS